MYAPHVASSTRDQSATWLQTLVRSAILKFEYLSKAEISNAKTDLSRARLGIQPLRSGLSKRNENHGKPAGKDECDSFRVERRDARRYENVQSRKAGDAAGKPRRVA